MRKEPLERFCMHELAGVHTVLLSSLHNQHLNKASNSHRLKCVCLHSHLFSFYCSAGGTQVKYLIKLLPSKTVFNSITLLNCVTVVSNQCRDNVVV